MSRRLYQTEIRVLAAVLALCGLLLTVLILQILGDFLMRRLPILAACALSAVALSGCGYTALGRGAVKLLPDYEIRAKPALTCSEFLVRIDPEAKLSNAQQRSALTVCEDLTKGVVIRPSEVQDAMRQTVPGLP